MNNKDNNIVGKTLVLVDSDNPWYLNRDTTIPMPYKKNNLPWIERYENKSEKKKDTNQDQIIFILMILIAILIIYSFFIKKKSF